MGLGNGAEMKKQVSLTLEDNLLTLKATFANDKEALELYENIVSLFKAGKDATLELKNPEPTQ